MKQVGIEVTLESTDTGGWARRVSDWDYDTSVNFLYQYGDPTLGVERTYVSTNIQKIVFTNTGGYVNPEVDKLFAEARNAPLPADRQKAFYAVQTCWCSRYRRSGSWNWRFPPSTTPSCRTSSRSAPGIHAPFDDVSIA